jgi:micrococcal nuclease
MSKDIVYPSFTYRAQIRRVYDADTVYADIDLGLQVWLQNQPLRLLGVDAPEVRGPERPLGLQARDWLDTRLLNVEPIIATYRDKKGKYGRWLAELFDDYANVNIELVESGHAILMPGYRIEDNRIRSD